MTITTPSAMTGLDLDSLSDEQRSLLDRLPHDTEIHVTPIVTRRGVWYTVQADGRVLSREDDLTSALARAVESVRAV